MTVIYFAILSVGKQRRFKFCPVDYPLIRLIFYIYFFFKVSFLISDEIVRISILPMHDFFLSHHTILHKEKKLSKMAL